MSRLINNNGIPNKCVGCEETSNCFGNMSCPEICKALEKLKHYEDLEDQGRLIELPCKVGDAVYNIVSRNNPPYRTDIIEKIVVKNDGIFVCFKMGLSKNIKCLHKSLFLSQEEAEKALKEMDE